MRQQNREMRPSQWAEEAAAFKDEGYAVLRNHVDLGALADLKDDVKAIFAAALGRIGGDGPHFADDKEFFGGAIRLYETNFDAYHGAAKVCNHLPRLHRIGTSNEALSTLRSFGLTLPTICARPVMWFHCKRLASTERYHRLPAHQEWHNMQGSLDGLVLWIPLIEVSEDMGRLQVLPGSHKEGLLPASNADAIDYPFALDESALRNAHFKEVDLRPGDALIFSSFLVHRSGVNNTDKIRWTINFRFNNALETSFVGRNFLDPFLYRAPDRLFHEDFPRPADVGKRSAA